METPWSPHFDGALPAAEGFANYVRCTGDSLTVGPGVDPGETYPEVLGAALGGTWYVHNAGVGGAYIAFTDYTTIDRDTDGRRTKDVLVVLLGTNDILLVGTDGTTTYNNLRAFCLARRTPGKKIIVCTLPGWNDGPWGQEADRIAYNDLIRTNWADFADGLADLGADPDIGTFAIGPYFLDNVHLDAPGYAVLGGIVEAAVSGLP